MIPHLIFSLLPLVLPTYVVRFHIGPFPTTALEMCLLILLTLWTWHRGYNGWLDGLRRLDARGWRWPIAGWLMAGIIAVFIAPNHIAGIGLFRAYFVEPFLVLCMLSDLLRTENDKKIFLRSVAVTLIGIGVWCAIQFLTHRGIPSPWDRPPNGIRATGPFPFPNAVSLFVVPLLAICFSLRHLFISRAQHILLWTACLCGTAAVIFAKSVGGALGLGAAVFIDSVLHTSTRRWAIGGAIIITIASLAIAPVRIKLKRQFFFQEWSGKVRVIIWKETRAMLKDHVVFGAGLGAYPIVIKPYHKATWMEIFQYPHNILLNLWSEVGLLGILAFTWILWRLGKNAGWFALPFIAAILIHGLVDVPYFKNDLAVAFWIGIALLDLTNGAVKPPPVPRPL